MICEKVGENPDFSTLHNLDPVSSSNFTFYLTWPGTLNASHSAPEINRIYLDLGAFAFIPSEPQKASLSLGLISDLSP